MMHPLAEKVMDKWINMDGDPQEEMDKVIREWLEEKATAICPQPAYLGITQEDVKKHLCLDQPKEWCACPPPEEVECGDCGKYIKKDGKERP